MAKLKIEHAYELGRVILDRDGKQWIIQTHSLRMKADGLPRYEITPIKQPHYGEMGYVVRLVTEQDIRDRNFGFREGHRIKMVDGELRRIPTRYT